MREGEDVARHRRRPRQPERSISELSDILKARKRLTFEALFDGVTSRSDLVITFLALLEMCKLRMTRLFQTELLAPIYVELAATEEEEAAPPTPRAAPPDDTPDEETT